MIGLTTQPAQYLSKQLVTRVNFDGVDDGGTFSNFLMDDTKYVEYKVRNFTGHVLNSNSNNNRITMTAGATSFQISGFNYSRAYTFLADTLYKIRYTRSGSTLTLHINNILIHTFTGATTLNFNFEKICIPNAGTGVPRGAGVLFDIDMNNETFWKGYGNTNPDWVDLISSRNITLQGSPATTEFYI